MAQRNSSSRGGTATRNRSSSSGQVNEREIGQLTVTEIRGRLRERGITGTSSLRKPDLVKALARSMRAEQRGGGRGPASRSTGRGAPATKGAGRGTSTAKSAGRATAKSAGRAAGATKSAGRATAKSAGRAAGSTKSAGRAGGTATSAGPARKRSTPAKKTTSAAGGRGGGGGGRSTGGARTASAPSRSLKYSQRISSPAEQPERPGRSLVTREHEVIQRWAEARQASPATIAGTEKGDRPGVLTFNFPGWREGGRLREIAWDEWFKSFDLRQLNFIYQEQLSDGRQSNFFRVESPEREDA